MTEVRERTRLEKAQGMGWMFVSLAIAGVIITAFMEVGSVAGIGYEGGLALAAIISMDALVFRWGVRRFDITPPKYFRAAADSSQSGSDSS